MKAIILAGGFGTRLREIAPDVPKPMVMIAGKPFLEHQILLLKEQNITEIILALHYRADSIKTYFGNGGWWGVNLTYSEEEVPLGTAGAIKKAEKYIDDTFIVMNGDSYSDIDIAKVIDFHKSKRSNFTMVLSKSNNPEHYGNVVLKDNKIIDFAEKKSDGGAIINNGIYVFEPKIFDYIEPEKNVSLEHEVFPKLAKEGLLYGYLHEGYFMDIGRPETYKKFKEDVLNTLMLRENNSVKEAMQKITKSGIDLILVTDEQKKLLGVLNDKIIKRFILSGGSIEDSAVKAMIRDPVTAKAGEDKGKINDILLTSTRRLPILDELGRVVDVEFRVEKIKPESFPVIRGKAPLRISFAGGGTDLPNFFEKYGGVVISATIDKYCHASIAKRADSKIIINSDLEEEIIINSKKDLTYDGKLDLVKAIIKMMNPEFGFELYIHNDIPPGRGLGSSASLSVLIISLISYLEGIKHDDHRIAELAYKVEREELKIKGGWQDQYAAITGGFNFMEFNGDKILIYPLRIKEEIINELNNRFILCYVGRPHSSGEIHKNIEQSFTINQETIVTNLSELKKIAVEIKECLLTNDLDRIGQLLHESWENKRKIDKSVSNETIDKIYEMGIKNGAVGGKLLGAGGGGYILFFCMPQKRNSLTRALQKNGYEMLNFNFDFKGTQLWQAKNKFNC